MPSRYRSWSTTVGVWTTSAIGKPQRLHLHQRRRVHAPRRSTTSTRHRRRTAAPSRRRSPDPTVAPLDRSRRRRHPTTATVSAGCANSKTECTAESVQIVPHRVGSRPRSRLATPITTINETTIATGTHRLARRAHARASPSSGASSASGGRRCDRSRFPERTPATNTPIVIGIHRQRNERLVLL